MTFPENFTDEQKYRPTVFSSCRKYRYTLWREWGVGTLPLLTPSKGPESYVQFIGLNPSTADEVQDDPTIRRCIDFAKRWGFGALCMTNAFAWRDTDPEKMKKSHFPIAELDVRVPYNENDYWLRRIANGAGLVIAAWGKHGKHLERDKRVVELIPELYCLGTNSDGTPRHPLYLPKTQQPIPYKPSEILARAIQDQVDKERCDVCDQRKCECDL